MPINPSPAVLRACDVLAHLASQPEGAFSVSELSREVGMPRATCDAVLLALAERGLVDRREPDLRYSLGPACAVLGDAARAAGALFHRVGPLAEALARETGSCVALSATDGIELRVEHVYDHGPAFGLRTRAGEAVPLAAPFGAVFVAWAPGSAVEQWLDRRPALGEEERAHYRRALAAVRERGYSITVADLRPELAEVFEQRVDEPDDADVVAARDLAIRELPHREYLPAELDLAEPRRVNQVSAPVFDRTGRVAIGIMVLGPNYDLGPAEIEVLGEHVLAVSREATDRIGGATPHPLPTDMRPTAAPTSSWDAS